jgi:succinoglycan biosynthesis protein ExoU
MRQAEPLSIAALLRGHIPWETVGLPIGYMKPIMSRVFLCTHGISYDESIRISEDYLLYFEIIKAGGRIIFDDSQGYLAREREASLSHGDHTIHRRNLDVHRTIAKRLRGGSKLEKAALARRKDGLLLELAISDFRRGDFGGAALAIIGIRPAYLLGRISHALAKRLGR